MNDNCPRKQKETLSSHNIFSVEVIRKKKVISFLGGRLDGEV